MMNQKLMKRNKLLQLIMDKIYKNKQMKSNLTLFFLAKKIISHTFKLIMKF